MASSTLKDSQQSSSCKYQKQNSSSVTNLHKIVLALVSKKVTPNLQYAPTEKEQLIFTLHKETNFAKLGMGLPDIFPG